MQQEYRSQYYDELGSEPVLDDFSLPKGTELTPELLRDLIEEHKESRVPRYRRLRAAFENKAGIFNFVEPKALWRPDNRIAMDAPRYLVTTFEGYFIGSGVTRTHPDELKAAWIAEHARRNDQDDVDAQLSEACSVYGHAYELLYHGADGEPRSVARTPITTFVVYDDTVDHEPMFGVCYSYDEDGYITGTVSDAARVVEFTDAMGAMVFGEVTTHAFGEVPLVEYSQGNQKRGLFEGVLTLVDAYNKTLSEKANDVEYFADAILKVIGRELTDVEIEELKSAHVINLWGTDVDRMDVDFLAKPNGDATQENLLSRLENLIFKTAMVPDITDESFATASGSALKWRLQPMATLAKTKERKFTSAMLRRYRLLAAYPSAKPYSGEDWLDVGLSMTRTMPTDIESEAATAGALAGIVSEETQLSVLSIVPDPKAEIARMEAEKASLSDALETGGYPIERTDEGSEDGSDL